MLSLSRTSCIRNLTPARWKYQWCNISLLHVHYPVVIFSLRSILLRSITLLKTLVGISGSVWLEFFCCCCCQKWYFTCCSKYHYTASNIASSNVMAALCLNCSSVSFSNTGSMHTSWHTSFFRLTVMFLSLLWHSVMNPHFLYVAAGLMFKSLQNARVFGVCVNGQLYLMLARFLNSCLLRMYPSSSICRVVSHIETPCSALISFNLHCWPVSLDLTLTSFCWL